MYFSQLEQVVFCFVLNWYAFHWNSNMVDIRDQLITFLFLEFVNKS